MISAKNLTWKEVGNWEVGRKEGRKLCSEPLDFNLLRTRNIPVRGLFGVSVGNYNWVVLGWLIFFESHFFSE